jgi:hypothetical protein
MATYYDKVSALAPKVWFKFNETTGTPLNSGSDTCTLTAGGTGTTKGETGIVDKAIKFPDTGAYTFSTLSNVMNDKSFTVELWHKAYQQLGVNGTSIFNITKTIANNQISINWTSDMSGLVNPGKYQVFFRGGATGAVSYTLTPANKSTENEWHHIVFTCSPSELVLYIDGTQVATQANPVFGSDFDFDTATRTRRIAERGFSVIDEVAIYGQVLTAQQVYDNYDAAFNSLNLADVSTASALAVDPAISTQVIIVETPATASAASGDHYNSTRDNFILLDGYLSTLTLEQWYKFDEPRNITNLGTGGSTGYIYSTGATNSITDGVQGSGALRINGGSDYVYTIGTTATSTEFTDDDFSLGFWVKKTTAEFANIFIAYNSGITEYLLTEWTDAGHILVNARLNNSDHEIETTADYTDGNWHYVAVRKSGNTMQMWVDNVSQGTVNVNQSMSGFVFNQFGGGNSGPTEQMYISQFYIGTSANITSTQIANIYAYGTPTVQAGAAMADAKFSRNDSFNNYVESKGPEFYFKMDEATGVPVNTGSVSLTLTQQGTNFTQNIASPNYKSYNFSNRDTQFNGAWSAPSGTFSTDNKQTLVVYAKYGSAGLNAIAGTAAFEGGSGTGMFLQQQANGTMRLRSSNGATTEDANTTTSYADNAYHMFVGVKDGSNLILYVDGVQAAINTSATHTFSDAGQLAVGGPPGQAPASATRNLTIDEVAVFNTAFTAQEAFEIYQSVDWEMDWTATAEIIDVDVEAGFGPTIAEPAMLASAELPKVFPFIPPMISEAMFLQPNFEAIDNTDNLAEPMEASAQGEDPGWDIGENNQVLHMDASASFPDPRALIPGFWNANPFIANPAEMVEPAISSTLGALVIAQSIPVQAIFVSPPAYKLITDDIWYQKLFLQHSIVNGERFRTSNLPNDTGTSSASAFLKLFDDVTQSLGGANTNQIINNLPRSIVIDTPTNTDTATQYAIATNAFQTASPAPLLEVGTFDDYERKAVRFRNIQFSIPENNFVSNNGYSLEFTFKSTKSDQVLAQGFQQSFTGNQSATSSIGLVDGKLYATRATQGIGEPRIFAHPDNTRIAKYSFITAYGNKRIDDGLWHHIIIQYGFDGRVQFWIDGQLDIQFFAGNTLVNGAGIRPYIIGSNHSNPRWQSDFETSAWSYDAAFFVDSQNITEHYTASIKYEPIKATPATASIELGQGSKAEGNRGRALMLYFWPTSSAQTRTPFGSGPYTSTESPDTLTTLDYFTAPPQEFEGWDVFPVDVTGRWVSDLVKIEAYGAENIGRTNFIDFVGPFTNTRTAPFALFNTRGTFRDPLTDAPRYIDLINDIDLSKFDMIMFKNYPNDPNEKDAFSGAEVVDAYFNLRESKIFEDFVKSLRAAVDTGLSLMVANAQLALDLKIVDRVETVPDMDDNVGQGNYSDPYSPTQMFGVEGANDLPVPPQYDEPLGWEDTWKNNRTRIVNTHPGITDYPALVKTQQAYWVSTDEFRWGGADRQFVKYEHKDALAVGDEFVISTTGGRANRNQRGYQATPFENVKVGKIITAFANTVRRGLDLIENPYRNYAQSIIIEPGDVLDGTQVGGKIFVNFTEEINKCQETGAIELSSDYWVNYAYENGAIDLGQRDQLLAEEFVTTETPYWSVNGMNLLQQTGAQFELDTNFEKPGVQKQAVRTRKINKNGGLSFQSVPSGSQFFSFTFSWRYPMANFEVPSMPTRGFRWLSNREVLEGTLIRPQAFAASAEMPNAAAVPDKEFEFNAQSMLATAILPETQFSSGERKVNALPMTATATIVKPGSTIGAPAMVANAGMFANSRPNVASEDQVVLYLIHVDPILYIREDVIK